MEKEFSEKTQLLGCSKFMIGEGFRLGWRVFQNKNNNLKSFTEISWLILNLPRRSPFLWVSPNITPWNPKILESILFAISIFFSSRDTLWKNLENVNATCKLDLYIIQQLKTCCITLTFETFLLWPYKLYVGKFLD